MKNIKFKSAILALAGFTMTSCADFLDITPLTLVVEDNYWNEKNDVDQIVTGCYTRMQDDDFMFRLFTWGEMRSDNVARGNECNPGSSEYELLRENILSTNAYTDWTSFYSVINRCNLVIERAPQVAEADPSFTQSDLNATVAEVSALRALCYFYLVRTFRDVPYYTYAITNDEQDMDLPATDGDQIIRNLIADLENVQNNAIKVYADEESNYGRITQNAIHALLADMYLWIQDYSNCARYSQMVINDKLEEFEDNGFNYDYPLIPDVDRNGNTGLAYQEIFGDGGSIESIFELDFTDENDGYKSNNMVPTFFYKYIDENKAGTIAPSQVLITEFTTASIFMPTSSTNTKTSDCRLYESILPNEFESASNGTIAKYVYTEIPTISHTNMSNVYSIYARTAKNGANWIFYRTSDVMLMKAEALANMISTDVESEMTDEDKARLKEAFDLVKAVNDRSNLTVGASSLTESDYDTKAAMIDLVLEERRREFLFEGKRWFDLVRYSRRVGNTQKLKEMVSQKFDTNASVATSKLSSMDAIYMPYNYDELRVNPNLHQNPAYGDGEDTSYETTK